MEKPFIELSVVQSTNAHSTLTQFQYFKVLIQEFAVKVDIGLIEAVLTFMRSDDVRCSSPPRRSLDCSPLRSP